MRRSNEIFFHHIRYTKTGKVFDRNDYVVQFEDGQKQVSEEVDAILDPHKGVTIAFRLKEQESGLDSIQAAYARCHSGSKDVAPTLFNKKEGRGEALARLHAEEDVLERITLMLTPGIEHWSVDEITQHVHHSVLRAISQNNRSYKRKV